MNPNFEKLAAAYSASHEALRAEITALQLEIEQCQRARLPDLKRLVAVAKERQARLSAAIEAAPQDFEKPRTYILHGIKFGLQKQRGGLQWSDDAAVIARIEKLFDGDAAQYLRVKKSPDKEALAKLTICQLRQLGIELVADADAVIIKPVDGDVDKLVAALLKDTEENAER
jgi:hypothetical protein